MPEALVTPIMALGSFVAGSTFLGGGAVAFPALTKILNVDPDTAKTFSLAIQSVGMSSASLYILLRVRSTIPWPIFPYYLTGALIGLLLSLGLIEQWVSANDLRIGFTLFVVIFVLIYLWAYTNKEKHYLDIALLTTIDKGLLISAGCLGGMLSGLIGSGADLVAFCVLALYFRLDLKLATQCSVIIMACSSIAGIAIQGLAFNSLSPEVMHLWLLASPVVIVGAPIGAIFCRRATNKMLLLFISSIVGLEVMSTVLLVPINPERLLPYGLLCLFSTCLLIVLQMISKTKNHTLQHPAPTDPGAP